MKIIIVHKSRISSFPPIIALLEALNSLGVEIHVVCGKDDPEFLQTLYKFCKEIHVVSYNTGDGKIGKVLSWLKVRRKFWEVIKKQGYDRELLWVPTADTTLALGEKLLKTKFILNLFELFDTYPLYKKGLKKFALNASVVVCPEITRAHIFRSWWGLNELPIVLPNKPFFVDRERFRELPHEIISKFNTIKQSGKKIAIYQGILTPDRGLDLLCTAFNDNLDFQLVLMGRETELSKELLKRYSNIEYIPFILPPYHLNITSHADIGILSYDTSTLNNIFCAPNKVWEYAALGVPMLGNDIPGLINVIELNKVGKCANFHDIEDINQAIKSIESNYDIFSRNSYDYFDTVDIKKVIETVLKKSEKI